MWCYQDKKGRVSHQLFRSTVQMFTSLPVTSMTAQYWDWFKSLLSFTNVIFTNYTIITIIIYSGALQWQAKLMDKTATKCDILLHNKTTNWKENPGESTVHFGWKPNQNEAIMLLQPTHLAGWHTLILPILMEEIHHLDFSRAFVPLLGFFHKNISQRLAGIRRVQQLFAGSWDYSVALFSPTGPFCASQVPNDPVGAASWRTQSMGHPWPSQSLPNLYLNWSILAVRT